MLVHVVPRDKILKRTNGEKTNEQDQWGGIRLNFVPTEVNNKLTDFNKGRMKTLVITSYFLKSTQLKVISVWIRLDKSTLAMWTSFSFSVLVN